LVVSPSNLILMPRSHSSVRFKGQMTRPFPVGLHHCGCALRECDWKKCTGKTRPAPVQVGKKNGLHRCKSRKKKLAWVQVRFLLRTFLHKFVPLEIGINCLV
jgi:hypothetical protein